MAEKSEKVKQVFFQAVEISSADERASFLDGVCEGDAILRQRVEALIVAHERPDSLLDNGAVSPALTITQPITETADDVIGPYKLLQQIGEGGMGVVFLAEQERPVRRKVALKIIKPGMDTRQVIARFEAERQALAMMDHPNIARVYDAGTTENSRPYFVMELVQGVPITEYCDECNLTTRERLELFVTVCQAVQHAHQKGIIHRDLKPTNVLVAIQDGRPGPKIIDFGVAKAIEQRLTEHTQMTAFAQMVGTPLYMSPEQAELSPLGVDTRSDIYSLGVMLYELLSGTTPFDKERLHAVPYDELRRIIREEEPPRPSARLSSLSLRERAGVRETAKFVTTIAEKRRTEPRRLIQTIHGELDWIVMKCLEKDRNRRYETPNSLARDIERYLHDEPVQACPPSTAYRLRKYARRNRTLLVAGGAIAAALVVGVGLSAWQYLRATTESARAQAVSDLLQDMLSSADSGRVKGVDYTVRELLDETSARLGSQLADLPAARAEIHATIARAYCSLLLPDKAQPHFEKAIELQREIDGPQHEKLAAMLVDYAWNLHDQARYVDAEAQIRAALEIYDRRGVTGGPVLNALGILQHVLISSGRYDDAERVTEQALAVAIRGPESPIKASLLHRYAGMRNQQGRFVEAEQLARQAVAMHRQLRGDHHPETAWSLHVLANSLQGQQKLSDAESALRESLAIFRRCYGNNHDMTQSALGYLTSVLEARGDTDAMDALAREQAELANRSDNPANHVRIAEVLLAETSSKDARKTEARRLIQRAMDDFGQMAADAPHDQNRGMEAVDGYLAVARLCLTDPDLAQEVDEAYHRGTEELEKLVAEFPDSVSLLNTAAYRYNDWAFLVEGVSRYWPQYENSLRQSVDLFEKVSLKDPKLPRVWFCLAVLSGYFGDAAWVSAKSEDAEAAFKRAVEICDQHRAEFEKTTATDDIKEIVKLYTCLAYHLTATERSQAVDYVDRASASARTLTDPTFLAGSLYYVALMQARLGDTAGYRATCETIVSLPMSEIESPGKKRPIETSCLLPGALEDPSVPVKLAEEVLAAHPPNDASVGPKFLGVALYRAGQFDEAAKQLEKAIELYPSGPPLPTHSINSTRLLLAMTKWQLGQQDAARELLSETLPAVEEEVQKLTTKWNRRASLELLRGEAEALIKVTETSKALENERTNDE
jgi:serine/threonine protein kinase/Tfp pilus assembly protein PilF